MKKFEQDHRWSVRSIFHNLLNRVEYGCGAGCGVRGVGYGCGIRGGAMLTAAKRSSVGMGSKDNGERIMKGHVELTNQRINW